jgi:hypothetical protein
MGGVKENTGGHADAADTVGGKLLLERNPPFARSKGLRM